MEKSHDLDQELKNLRDWKKGALLVMDGWGKVFDELYEGEVSALGRQKSAWALEKVCELKAELESANDTIKAYERALKKAGVSDGH